MHFSLLITRALWLCILLTGYIVSYAQTKQTESIRQTWLAYMNQTRFSDRFGMWADLQLRTKEDFVNDLSQSIVRLGLSWYAHDNTRLTAGYAWVNHFPGDNHRNISQPEHRPWQQIQWFTKYSKLRTMQYLRLEERYRRKVASNDALADGYNFNFRLRYNFLLTIPFGRPNTSNPWSGVINNEVHVNFGKEVVNNYFDQNRFFVGFNYATNTHDYLQFGYMNVFQQLAAGNRYKSLHVARVAYFQNLDLRKK